MKDYKVVDGVSFYEGTNESVINILLDAMKHKDRIRVFFGDAESGTDWCETYDTMGTIGTSCGMTKIPLLIHSIRSTGGDAILTDSIVKITRNKKVIYKHPNYNCNIKIDGDYIVDDNGKNVSHFWTKDENKRKRFYEFLKGTRNNY
jgi:hypothetical protein